MRAKKESIQQAEQETVIVIDPVTKKANVYSCIPSMVKKLYKFAEHEDAEIDLDNSYGLAITVPQNWIKIRPPVKRQMTEEQKAAMMERMNKARKEKQ